MSRFTEKVFDKIIEDPVHEKTACSFYLKKVNIKKIKAIVKLTNIRKNVLMDILIDTLDMEIFVNKMNELKSNISLDWTIAPYQEFNNECFGNFDIEEVFDYENN